MKIYLHQDECGLCILLGYTDDGVALTFQNAFLVDGEYKPFGPNILPLLNKMWIVGNIYPNQLVTQTFLFGIMRDIKGEERLQDLAP